MAGEDVRQQSSLNDASLFGKAGWRFDVKADKTIAEGAAYTVKLEIMYHAGNKVP